LNGEYETWNAVANLDPQSPILPAEKLALIHRLHLQSVTVGLSMDKSPLLVKPKSLRCSNDRDRANCLTAAQIAVVDKLYGGPVDREAATLPRQSNGGSRAIVCPTVHAAWNVSLSGNQSEPRGLAHLERDLG